MRAVEIWAAPGAGQRLTTNDPNVSHQLLVDPDAGNGQQFSFDQFSMIMMVCDNNASAPDEHGTFYTPSDLFRRLIEFVGWSDTSFCKIRRNSNSTFSKVGGEMGLRSIYGIQHVTHADLEND